MHPPLAIRFPEPMLAAIDAMAASRMDKPDRSTLIRELVAEALATRGRKK